MARKISKEPSRQPSPTVNTSTTSRQGSRKSSRDTHHTSHSGHTSHVRETGEYSPQRSPKTRQEYSPQRESPHTSTPNRKTSHDALSRSSALNERYFEIEKARSRSLDNLLNEPEPTPLQDLGLSQSRLNDRYHSVEQLAPIKPVIAQPYMSKQEIDFEYPDVSSISTSHRGGPRYIKSQYTGKKAPPGSHSSRAHIEKSEFGVRSSAMSDTSEAPSLASHVRRVRVPSQASDVDQFLDELFSPVLDGNLDELSDARSLAASIKGGGKTTCVERFNLDVESFYADYVDNQDVDNKDVNNLYAQNEDPSKYFDPLSDIDISDLDLDLSPNQLALKIKGGGDRNRSSSQSSATLDQEVEKLTSKRETPVNSNVDDYISDLFRPIFINDSIKTLTEKQTLVESIKGGGTTHQPSSPSTSSFNYPTMVSPTMLSPQPMMVPDGFVPMFNMPLPQNADMAAYQQNLQRAFLQSAMAQNIQIQQQLLAQNQALQQLLTQAADTKPESPVKASTPTQKPPFGKISSRKSSSPSSNSIDFTSRKASTESNVSVISRNNVPPPPPMPPPLDGGDPSEVRPFMDPYGRAKTVRIGKWRWPPPNDGNTPGTGEDFMQFKMRQNQRKVTPNKDTSLTSTVSMMSSTSKNGLNNSGSSNGFNNSNSGSGSIQHSNSNNGVSNGHHQPSAEWDEIDFESPVVEKTSKVNTKRSFEIGASRPSPGSVGKLKLSSEMRQRLEMVTANHSVRSTSSKIEKPSRAVNKLEDTRKMMLEQQLRGRWGDPEDNPPSPPSPVVPSHVRSQVESKSPTQQSWNSSNWKPGPPPPPIGPLPPAPSGIIIIIINTALSNKIMTLFNQ